MPIASAQAASSGGPAIAKFLRDFETHLNFTQNYLINRIHDLEDFLDDAIDAVDAELEIRGLPKAAERVLEHNMPPDRGVAEVAPTSWLIRCRSFRPSICVRARSYTSTERPRRPTWSTQGGGRLVQLTPGTNRSHRQENVSPASPAPWGGRSRAARGAGPIGEFELALPKVEVAQLATTQTETPGSS